MNVECTPLNGGHRKMAEELRRYSSQVDPGDKLPSVRELMRRFDVGQSVVEKALLVLQEDGVVESIPRTGYFVCESRKMVDVIDVLFFGPSSSVSRDTFHYSFLNKLGELLGDTNRGIRVSVLGEENAHAKLVSLMEKQRIGAAFAVCISDKSDVGILDEYKVSYVHVFPNLNVMPSNSISIDNEGGIRQIMNHLVSCGHSKIAYLHLKNLSIFQRDLWERHELFYRFSAEMGLKARAEWVRYCGYDSDSIMEATSDLFTTDGDRPTAIIINDIVASHVYRALGSLGLTVGKDISVVGFDDLAWAEHMHPALTTVHNFIDEEAQKAIAMLDALLNGGKELEPQIVKTELRVRDSTGRV